MPLIKESDYKRPFFLFNHYLETILPSTTRNIRDFEYNFKEKLRLSDGDFLRLSWKKSNSQKRIVVISHGLEGDSNRPYIKGTAKLFTQNNWDAVAWNYRSCGDEMNDLPRLYHHGVSDDLKEVVDYVVKQGYEEIVLVGFSMGGSTTLKYLGEFPEQVSDKVKAAAVFSVPVNLANSSKQLDRFVNRIYLNRFMKKLKTKLILKQEQFNYSLKIDIHNPDAYKSFSAFDTAFTSPLHGFADARDFYSKTNADQFLANIDKPTLIANAKNDTMLGQACYPYELIETLDKVYLETPSKGGHVGFTLKGSEFSWAEKRALEFCSAYVSEKQNSST